MDIESIFDRAQSMDSHELQQAYLDQACGDDSKLRARLEALLRASRSAGSFLEKPPAGLIPTIATGDFSSVDDRCDDVTLSFLTPSSKPNCLGTLGQYEVVDVVGRGGMGLVLRAYDTRLSRIVAIKVLAPELAASPMAVKRFLREARAAAAVSHDHVVTIHAVDDAHRPPFIVMEFVDGQSLQQKLDRNGALKLGEILRIGMQMARGLAAAHEQGLVHRDIKPANILLENGIERVKLTDFGLARAVDDVSVTRTGQIAGTPQFMSPEQAQGHPIDSRSDLFSLGSVLYAMCTGRPPFRAETPLAMLRRVADDAPRPIREVNQEIPDWLEAIVLKLLAKSPAERFRSAEEVGSLLNQHLVYLQNPATAARPDPVVLPPSHESLSAWPVDMPMAMRAEPKQIPAGSPWLVVLVAAVMLVGIGFIALALSGTDWYFKSSQDASRNAQVTVTPDSQPQHPAGRFQHPAPFQVPEFRTAEREFAGPHSLGFSIAISDDGRRAAVGHSNGRVSLWDIATGQRIHEFNGAQGAVHTVLFWPDGQHVAAASEDGTIRLWDLATAREIRQFRGHTGRVDCITLSGDGAWLLSGAADYGRDRDRSVRLWNAVTGAEVRRFDGVNDYVRKLVFSTDGLRAYGTGMGAAPADFDVVQPSSVAEWDVETGRRVQTFPETPTRALSLAVSPTGKLLAAGHMAHRRDGKQWDDPDHCVVRLWDLASRTVQRELRGHTGPVGDLAFSGDGRFLLTVATGEHDGSEFVPSADQTVRLWEVATGREVARYQMQQRVIQLALAPDDRSFVTVGDSIRVWEMPEDTWPQAELPEKTVPVAQLREVGRLEGHSDAIDALAYSLDGVFLYSGGGEGRLYQWAAATGRLVAKVPCGDAILSIAPLPGSQAVVSHFGGGVALWDLDRRVKVREFPQHAAPVRSIAATQDGTRLLTGSFDGKVRLLDVASGHVLQEFDDGFCSAVAIASEAPVAAHGVNDQIHVWRTDTGTSIGHIPRAANAIFALALSADGKTVVSGDGDGLLQVWEVDSRSELHRLTQHFAGHKKREDHLPTVSSIQFFANGPYFATGGWDQSLRVFDTRSGRELAQVQCEHYCTSIVAVSPDGTSIASGGGIVTLRDNATNLKDGDYAIRRWAAPAESTN